MAPKVEKKKPWVSLKRRPRSKKRKNKTIAFAVGNKKTLAESDKGSWFNQVEQWSELKESTVISASTRKLNKESGTTITRFIERACDEEPDTKAKSYEDEGETPDMLPPKQLNIVDTMLLEGALETATVSKDCNVSTIEIIEISRHGLGATWELRCKNTTCSSHKYPTKFHTSKKQGKKFELNCAAVLIFRAIGKGFSAANKFCSILNLPRPIYQAPWTEHTKLFDEKATDLLEIVLESAAITAKEALIRAGDIEDCSTNELKNKICDVGVTIDGSWSSRGWCARDGVVAAISVLTGQVLDIIYLSSSCSQCTVMEGRRRREEITKKDYLAWYIRHEENCYLNHDGSASVRFYFLFFYFLIYL